MNSLDQIEKKIHHLEQYYLVINVDECSRTCHEAQRALAKQEPVQQNQNLKNRVSYLIEINAMRRAEGMQIKEERISPFGAFLIFMAGCVTYVGLSKLLKRSPTSSIATNQSESEKRVFLDFKPGLGGGEDGMDRENRCGAHQNEGREFQRDWTRDPRYDEAKRLKELGYEAYRHSKNEFDDMAQNLGDRRIFSTIDHAEQFLDDRNEAYKYFTEANRLEAEVARDAAQATCNDWDQFMDKVRSELNDAPRDGASPEGCCIQ